MTATFSSSIFSGYTVTVPVDLAADPNGLLDCSAVASSGGSGGAGTTNFAVTSAARITGSSTVNVVFADTSDATDFAAEQTAFSLVVVCL